MPGAQSAQRISHDLNLKATKDVAYEWRVRDGGVGGSGWGSGRKALISREESFWKDSFGEGYSERES